jgi:hypothetical protein
MWSGEMVAKSMIRSRSSFGILDINAILQLGFISQRLKKNIRERERKREEEEEQ